MQGTPDWGWSWTIAAYVVSWAVFIGYGRYVGARSRGAREALERETQRPASAD